MNFLNQLPDFNEIPWRDHANKGDFDGIFLNPLAITIQKWRTFKLLMWMKNLHQSTWVYEILYADRLSEDEQLLRIIAFPKNEECGHGGWLKYKIRILFCGDNS
jgi:hypothetical protein